MEAEKSSPPSPSPAPARLRIAGAWSGVLEVHLDTWTVPMLRAEVAARCGGSPERINLISGGKLLRDGEGEALGRSLMEVGLKNNCKILTAYVSTDQSSALNNEADRSRKLDRIRAAALAMAERHVDGDAFLSVEDFNMEIENQSGQTLMFVNETDKRGLIMGLMLHSKGKSLVRKQQYKDALDVLSMAEGAFSQCNPKAIEMTDNVPILELDTVWCYFMLRDISCLSMAGERLAKSRKGFERTHGKDSTRFRILQAGRHADLAIYVRLELLEGVVAYYNGNMEESRKALSSAQAKYDQLQVTDEALAMLIGMGYKERAAKRALRMTGQDIESAVDFLVEERATKIRKHHENIQRQSEINEQRMYGRTPQQKAVNLERLNELVSIGFEKYLAAEALRVNENDSQKALDDLTNPEKNHKFQYTIEIRKKAEARRQADADIEELMAMGYERSAVVNAVRTTQTREEALTLLLDGPGNQQAEGNPPPMQGEASDLPAQQQAGPERQNRSNPLGPTSAAGSSSSSLGEERDEAMEAELAEDLTGDAYEDYDIEVAKEGEAIAEYLTLIDSVVNASKASG